MSERSQQIALGLIDDAGKFLLETLLTHRFHEATRCAGHQWDDLRREDGDVASAVLAIDAVLDGELVIERFLEGQQAV